MKKIIIFILICALSIIICGCQRKTTVYPDGAESVFGEPFVKIKQIAGNIDKEQLCFVYDSNTKVVYLHTRSGHHATMCPYYVVDENNKPTVAIYGVNYEVN